MLATVYQDIMAKSLPRMMRTMIFMIVLTVLVHIVARGGITAAIVLTSMASTDGLGKQFHMPEVLYGKLTRITITL